MDCFSYAQNIYIKALQLQCMPSTKGLQGSYIMYINTQPLIADCISRLIDISALPLSFTRHLCCVMVHITSKIRHLFIQMSNVYWPLLFTNMF